MASRAIDSGAGSGPAPDMRGWAPAMNEDRPRAEPADPLAEALKRHWGFDGFLPLQREAMAAIREGRDSLVVLPTGGGKSLCFQAPALLGEGLAVVVSPLIALMKDQVDGLVANGVPAAFLNSSQPPAERRRVRERLVGGHLRLLYVSPERLAGEGGEGFTELLARVGVRYFAIDEAHCISQWGHAFRPEYRRLGSLREIFPGVSLHGFTATATRRVREDIVEQLGLERPRVLVGSFDRPNLVYRVFRRGDAASQVRRVIERHPGEAGIVYCITRREVESLASRLAAAGFPALPYHAGMDAAERSRNQDAFLGERVGIVVATVAFGMGIDRPDVRFVLHTGSPRSLEHYQQESGRAGRDGLEAECVLLYSAADFVTWRRLLERGDELDDSARRLLADMQRFAGSIRCRHKALVEYFGEEYPSRSCGACDWCLGELERVAEPRVLAQKILSCVLRLRERWGMVQVVDVLRGRDTAKIRDNRHDELSTFGLLDGTPAGELRGYVEQLLDRGLLAHDGDRYPVLKVTEAGRDLLREREGSGDFDLYRQRRPKRPKRAPARGGAAREIVDSWEGVDRDLFDSLRELRRKLAAEREVPPYVIFHDSTLRDMARKRPASREALLTVYGIGEKKAADPGPRFLEAIAAHGEGGPPAPTV